MNTTTHAIIQAVVTLALLVFAYVMEPRSPGVSNLVVGATIAYWLRASADLVQDQRKKGA
jgi:hypothetical protein